MPVDWSTNAAQERQAVTPRTVDGPPAPFGAPSPSLSPAAAPPTKPDLERIRQLTEVADQARELREAAQSLERTAQEELRKAINA